MSYQMWCHCCICGEGYPEGASHKCDPKKLARRDAAMKANPEPFDRRSEGDRIRQGFDLMSMSGDMEFCLLDWENLD